MRIETTDNSIKLVEFRESDGLWLVRWDFKPKLNEDGTESGIYWYEEEAYKWIPTIVDIQRTIIEWHNKQTDGMIQHGFTWNGITVYLSDENKFNFKAIADEAARREAAIAIWDEENPELAGKEYIETGSVDSEGNPVATPTGRPYSLLPVTLKLGTENTPENFYVFNTLEELQSFFAAGVDHLIAAYGVGWYKISTFNWQPYVDALAEL